ncbi:PaaI family thioesterase [Phaeobacter sp. SYSU ZJ3003]|uniref:PaaI family thioesterase n=1 Tax=Phaeobacter sp. SYSU ZJ3003 TaxID=2109330 RepID=UPI00351C4EDA
MTATMTPADLQSVLAEGFADWVQALDLTVTEASPEETTLRMPLTPNLARMGGIVSGQALAALADTSMVLAAFACGFQNYRTAITLNPGQPFQ